jgi:hypothetical protein
MMEGKEKYTMRPLRTLAVPLAFWCVLAGGLPADAACPDTDPADGICDVNLLNARVHKTPFFQRVSLKGQIITDPGSGDVFDASATITVHAEDYFQNLSHDLTWTPAECQTKGRRIRCITTDRSAKAVFTTFNNSPNVIRFFIRGDVDIPLEAQIGISVTMRLTHNGGVLREGILDECKVTPRGLNCRHL